MGRRVSRWTPRQTTSTAGPAQARHCGNGRASTANGATTVMSNMCCTMCQAVLLPAMSSKGPNKAMPAINMAT